MKTRKVVVATVITVLLLSVLSITVFAMNSLGIFSKIAAPGTSDIYGFDGELIDALGADKMLDSIPAETLLKKSYDSYDFRQTMGITLNGKLLNLNRVGKSLNEFNDFFPIECLRKINDDLVYAVYRLHDADGFSFNSFVFFEKTTTKDGKENWECASNMMMADQMLSYSDFASIAKGSLLSAVLEITKLADIQKPKPIDPYWNDIYDESKGEYRKVFVQPEIILNYETCYYLSDGILRINFARENEDSEYYVQTIDYVAKHTIESLVSAKEINVEVQNNDFPLIKK